MFDLASELGKPPKSSRNRETPRNHEFTQGDRYRVLCRGDHEHSFLHLKLRPDYLWLVQVQKDLA